MEIAVIIVLWVVLASAASMLKSIVLIKNQLEKNKRVEINDK